MKKGFSILNIIIIAGFLVLGFLMFNKFAHKNDVNIKELNNQTNQDQENLGADSLNIAPSVPTNKKENKLNEIQMKASALPDPSTLPTTDPGTYISAGVEEKIEVPAHNGTFLNEKYNYSIKFPPSWNLKDTYADNISIGSIPPKNGLGALNIKIGSDTQGEISKLKSEVKKYTGILSLEEKSTSIDGVTANELILINLINNTRDVYTIFSYAGTGYVIKYNSESDDFVKQAKTVLANFKFITKK